MLRALTSLLFLVFACVSLPHSGYGKTASALPLTLMTALQKAYEHNTELRAARERLRAVQELLPQAHAGWKPIVLSDADLTHTKTEGSNFPGAEGSTEKSFGISVDQPLFRGGRTFAETAEAKNTISFHTEALRATEQSILLRTVTVYMDVLLQQSIVNLTKVTRDVLAKELEIARSRFEAGEITLTDVSQAQARLAEAEADVITAYGALDSLSGQLTQVTGVQFAALVQPVSQNLPVSTLNEAHDLAQAHNPLIRASYYAHKASEDTVDKVYGELLPSIGVFGSWRRSYDPAPGLIDRQTSTALGISAQVPLYQGGGVRSRVREAKHEANAKYIDTLGIKREVRQTLTDAWAAWQSAQAEITARRRQVEAAALVQEGTRLELDVGTRMILDVLNADRDLLEAQVALAKAQRDSFVHHFSVLAAIGNLSLDISEFGDDAMTALHNF